MFAGNTRVRSLWTPRFLPETEVWLDASNSASIVLTEGFVSQWSDLSGNRNHATQSTSSCRPTYVTGNFVSFDGVNDGLIFAGYQKSSRITNPRMSFFWAGFITGVGSNTRALFSFDGTVGGWNRGLFFFSNSIVAQGGGSTNNVSVIMPSGMFIASAIYDFPNNYYLGINGELTARGSSEGTSNNVTQPLSLGFGFPIATSGSQNLNCHVSDFIVVRGKVDIDTTYKVQGYLAHKRGLVAGLPIGHPYKNYPPRGV